MNKTYFFSLILFFSVSVNAQKNNKIILTSKVTKDSVYLKWIPANFESMLLLIEKGAKISYGENSTGSTAELFDYSNADLFVVNPAKERINRLNEKNEDEDKILSLVEPFTSSKVEKENDKNFAIGLLSIEMSISKQINKIIGSQLTLANPKSKICFKVSIEGIPDVFLTVNGSVITVPNTIPTLTGLLDEKRIIEINWDAQSVNKNYLGFVIERKKNNEIYQRFQKVPYVHFVTSSEKKDKLASYLDEKLEEGNMYTYRVFGLDYFGDEVAMSNEVKVYLPKLAHAEIFIDTVRASGFNRKIVAVIRKENSSNSLQLENIVFQKSSDREGPFKSINEQQFKDSIMNFSYDEVLETGDSYYYRMLGISSDQDTVYSELYYYFSLDQKAPDKLTGLVSEIDSIGNVTISWTKSEEKKKLGYRVFRANSKDEEFVELTKVFLTTEKFIEKLDINNLTSKIYYYAVVVDDNYNNSPSSDTLLVLKPDTIPPVAAVIRNIKQIGCAVTIDWVNSSSSDLAVNGNFLLRLSIADHKLDTVLKWSGNITKFLDSNLIFGNEYFYSIGVFDYSNNLSISKMRSVLFEPGFRESLVNVEATVNRITKFIEITWDQPNHSIFSFSIYKQIDDGKMELIKTIENSSLTNYIDTDIKINKKYSYLISYTTITGIRSLKHTPIKVVY